MTVYIVTQTLYCEGNFGDLEIATVQTIGIFSTLQLAEAAAYEVPQPEYTAQFGSDTQSCKIQEVELDKVNNYYTAHVSMHDTMQQERDQEEHDYHGDEYNNDPEDDYGQYLNAQDAIAEDLFTEWQSFLDNFTAEQQLVYLGCYDQLPSEELSQSVEQRLQLVLDAQRRANERWLKLDFSSEASESSNKANKIMWLLYRGTCLATSYAPDNGLETYDNLVYLELTERQYTLTCPAHMVGIQIPTVTTQEAEKALEVKFSWDNVGAKDMVYA